MSPTPGRRSAPAAVLAGLLLAVAAGGCSGSTPDDADAPSTSADADFLRLSAAEMRDRVVADMRSLESVTVSAELGEGAEAVSFDLSLDTDGTCTGTMAIGGEAGQGTAQGTAEFRSVDGASYLKGDADFWEASTGGEGKFVASLLGDRWALMPSGEGGFESVCDLDNLLAGFDATDDAAREVTRGAEDEVEGQPAVELVAEADGGTSRIWVASGGERHYILRLERDGEDAGRITLSDFDEPVEVTAPDEDQVVDLAQLGPER